MHDRVMERQSAAISKREANKLQKRARILLAARAEFHSHGFEGANMDAIARSADVAKGTLFAYARDKQDLLFQVFQLELEPVISKSLNRPFTSDIMAWVERHFRDLIDYNRSFPELGSIFIKEVSWMTEGRRDAVDHFLGHWIIGLTAAFRKAVTNGELRPDSDLETLAYMVMDMLLSTMRRWLSTQISEERMLTYLPAALQQLLEGVGMGRPERTRTMSSVTIGHDYAQ